MVVVERQADLFEVVLALRPGRGLADLLDGRQQQADQDGDDRSHHQQLNEGETSRPMSWSISQRGHGALLPHSMWPEAVVQSFC